ncbi:YihY/virulence factor BrkB family protein [Roseomonas hellenica]|uniref:YihY/virulence factor BrkB family protein n=1 Tax=Plastoroseomonas hellenica TaxID=2687306 RepID=A0ABS5F528_9PROT|nr:YihY/virulence factor BrkB family protein [Plastoroseomonas hellenica]MBR0667553.1 YihY/virulence factor BrkB family protein [Plastoroseomonas hellenica]
MLGRIRTLAVDTVMGFIADECLSRAAAIAYYTLFSIAPLLVIATAIAGFAFGEDAVQGAVAGQLEGTVGRDAAVAVQEMVRGASDATEGGIAAAIGITMLLLAASGAFGELQSALNAIWKTTGPPAGTQISRFLRAKAAAIGLVAATGFLLLVSLIVSAAIKALGSWIGGVLPETVVLLQWIAFFVPLAILTLLFGAIYKVLPDRDIAWRDVLVGAFATALLFSIGKTAIGLYLGSSSIGTSFGAAGALVVLLVWVNYSAVIFLLGAEFTRAWANMHGSCSDAPVPADSGGRNARAN